MNIDINNYRAVIDEINDAMTKSEKVEIINKYGLNCAPKLKDMEQAVYDILREDRKSRGSNLTRVDFSLFNRNNIGTFPSMSKALDMESREFPIEYLKYLKDAASHDKSISRRNYYNSLCKLVEKYILQHSLTSSASDIKDLEARLTEETMNFRMYHLDSVKKWAMQRYDRMPEALENVKARIKEILSKVEQYRITVQDVPVYDRLRKISNFQDKLGLGEARKSEYEFKEILKLTKKEYCDSEVSKAEKEFNVKLAAMSKTLYDKGFTNENINVKHIGNDPKMFEMLVSNGQKTFYARSIWAAENSYLVSPHFRFIVTSPKGIQ